MANKAPAQKQSSNISAEQQQRIEEDASKKINEKQEAAKAAERAQYCKKKAKELTDAAKACGDPDERQKLLNEALEKEVEAETFGKTAKYLNSGSFQGLVGGAGLGAGIGIWLGTVTGTIVGGTTGTITGGIGAGIGLGVGAVHGPFFKVGELMGNTLRKITGDIPGWKATKEQKAALEKMVNGVQNEEVPNEDELEMLRAGGAASQKKASTGQKHAANGVPSESSARSQTSAQKSTESGKKSQQKKTTPARDRPSGSAKNLKRQAEENGRGEEEAPDQTSAIQSKVKPGQAVTSTNTQKGSPNSAPSANSKQNNRNPQAPPSSSPSPKKTKESTRPVPQSRSSTTTNDRTGSGKAAPTKAAQTEEAPKKKPRKLEVRSAQSGGGPGTKRTTQRVRS